ncbi:peptide chain release factor N(5)-glutamine methyltransferase [Caviibacterium pharyngocola]|uniref:Release factor glutamine methyltransferase n=1 Tax=Caviibacterium pharyngocola TaxID=28159 RepID=A0A2M8RX28_9PAST|nr:peptide chain release factor N(5)-glutamine methyltransferase [Caviibacterium pharyngocola]
MTTQEKFETQTFEAQTYEEWLKFAAESLQSNARDNPYLDAKTDVYLLLSTVTQRRQAYIMAFPETLLTQEEMRRLSQLLSRRAKGEPMAYILGERDFWSLNLAVAPTTLIPRPDTEILVEKAVELVKNKINSLHFNRQSFSILDLGTGTGAIALALSAELTDWAEKFGVILRIWGADFLPDAVELARSNARRNHIHNVEFVQSDWFDNIHESFDMIVTNPPYIDAQDEHLTQGDVRFEPLTALVAAENGFGDLRHIIEQAPNYLKPQGYLLLEHGWQQGEKVRSFFAQNLWQGVETLKDYGDNERITLGRLK